MKGKVHTMNKNRLLSILIVIGVVLSCFSAHAQAMDIKYNMIRNSYASINDCAYNGSVYVFVGNAGFIAVSKNLSLLNFVAICCIIYLHWKCFWGI